MTATTDREAEAAVEPQEPKLERLTGGWRIVARKEFTDHVHSVRFVILVVLDGACRVGLGALGERADPQRRHRATADARRSSSTSSHCRPDASRRSTSSSASSAPCSASHSGSMRSTASARSARCRGSSPSRSTVTRSSTASSSPASAPSPSRWRVVMAIVVGYGMLRLGIGPSTSDFVRMVVVLRRRRRVHRAVAGVGDRLVGGHCGGPRRRRFAAIAIWLVFTLFGGLIAGLVADTVHPVPDTNPTPDRCWPTPASSSTCDASRRRSSTRKPRACC